MRNILWIAHITCTERPVKPIKTRISRNSYTVIERACYGNLGPPKILVLGTKFSGKMSPGGPILPENVDPCPKILVLPFACACAFSTRVESRCCKVSRKLLGWKDLWMLRVILLAKCSSIFSVANIAMERKGKKADDTEKALKFSVSSRGELFYRQKRKGKACSVNMCSSCKHFIWNPFLVNTQVDWAFSYRWGMMWQTKQTIL